MEHELQDCMHMASTHEKLLHRTIVGWKILHETAYLVPSQQVCRLYLVAVHCEVVQSWRSGSHKLRAGVGEQLINHPFQPSLDSLHLLIVPAGHIDSSEQAQQVLYLFLVQTHFRHPLSDVVWRHA